DREIAAVPDVHYFRYADDMLLLSKNRELALRAEERIREGLSKLYLTTKASHQADLVLTRMPAFGDRHFVQAAAFRHLGLQFDCTGAVLLSRDKQRKIQNLFRFAFRRSRSRWKKITDPREQARTLIAIAC